MVLGACFFRFCSFFLDSLFPENRTLAEIQPLLSPTGRMYGRSLVRW